LIVLIFSAKAHNDMASSGAAARGPLGWLLRSTGSQWLVLGAGTISFFPEQVREVAWPTVKNALGLTGSDADWPSFSLLSSQRSLRADSESQRSVPSSIVIHTSNGSSTQTWMTTIVTWTVGATAVWVAYSVFSNYLPDQIKTMLPVTRRVFDRATQTLADHVFHVKDVLGKQLLRLTAQQDELASQQQETHKDVRVVQQDMKQARLELMQLLSGMDRCEVRLEDSAAVQSYTARGVKLLAKCVASIMPGNERIGHELERFQRDDYPLLDNTTANHPHGRDAGPEKELSSSRTPKRSSSSSIPLLKRESMDRSLSDETVASLDSMTTNDLETLLSTGRIVLET
jgi:hypothetical protein